MNTDVVVEPFSRDDEATVKFLLVAAGLPVDDLSLDKLAHFLVARDDAGALIGAIGLEPFADVGLLRSLVVHDDQRGGGVGQELTRQLEDYAQKNGIKSLFLLTTTAADFFPKLDYRVIAREEATPMIRDHNIFETRLRRLQESRGQELQPA